MKHISRSPRQKNYMTQHRWQLIQFKWLKFSNIKKTNNYSPRQASWVYRWTLSIFLAYSTRACNDLEIATSCCPLCWFSKKKKKKSNMCWTSLPRIMVGYLEANFSFPQTRHPFTYSTRLTSTYISLLLLSQPTYSIKILLTCLHFFAANQISDNISQNGEE